MNAIYSVYLKREADPLKADKAPVPEIKKKKIITIRRIRGKDNRTSWC